MARGFAQKGLTLMELLVALLIFAFISSAGVYTMRLALDGREQLDAADERLRQWAIARLIIRQDLAQVAPRPVRDEFGDQQVGPMVSGSRMLSRAPVIGEEPLVGFVRRGWRNPENNLPRSTLQYVEYVARDGALIRRTRPYLDDAQNQPEMERVLIDGVRSIEFDFLMRETTRGLEWADFWPSPDSTAFAPRAVRITLEADRYGAVEQLFWIGDFTGATAQGAP
ncbi:MAG: type II secretion system minor pseudopilin GspJ [Pseudomonadota bacterium]